MKIGIATGAYLGHDYGRFGADAFRKIKEHGFDAIDYDMVDTDGPLYTLPYDEAEAAVVLHRQSAEQAGLLISQVHGPWRYPPRDALPEERAERMEKMKRSLRLTVALGCRYWVVHPIMPFGVEDRGTADEEKTFRLNLEFMTELSDYAAALGVTVCLENMPFLKFSLSKPADILRVVEAVNRPNFQVCLDTGHVCVFGKELEIGEEVRRLGDHLRVMHVHDNKKGRDLHLMPRMGILDWESLVAALKEIGYSGVFSLETVPPDGLPDELYEAMGRLYVKVAREILGS